jgi:methylated-DNA-[protein]-cysteine S-methyltransferase
MTAQGYTLFDTAIGRCGIAWTAHGVAGVQLPEADDEKTRARLRRRFAQAVEAAPPAAVRRAIDGIVALLGGHQSDLSAITLDMQGVPPFHRRVYAVARSITPGRTLTYRDIAAQLGEPGAARAVGQALGHNPFALIVPCHRVLAAHGQAGGFSAHGGAVTKLRLLSIEGVQAPGTSTLFDAA